MPKAILQSGVVQAEYNRVVWSVTPDADTTLDDMLAPAYWVHVAKQLKPGALIEVRPPNGEWFAVLYVRRSDATAVQVVTLHKYDFSEAGSTQPAPGEFEVKHRGPRGWSVLRRSDNAVVFEGGTSRGEAEEWITEKSIG